MNVDLLSGIELTACAGIVVAVLAGGLGPTARARAAIAGGFGLWFSFVTALAATETLHTPRLAGLAGLGLTIVVPVLTMIGGALVSERVRRSLLRIPVSWLVAANTVRVLGVSFLVLHSQGRLPAPFALAAGWGDIAIGLTAPLVAGLVAARGAQARGPLTIWNTLGLLDLIVAVSLGVASSPALWAGFTGPSSALMTTLPWLLIPGFLVPILAGSHLVIFYRLRVGHGRGAASRARAAHPTAALP